MSPNFTFPSEPQVHKKGYKTKTGFTSSVTLTLTKCGACGGVRRTSDVENGWYMERHGLPATI